MKIFHPFYQHITVYNVGPTVIKTTLVFSLTFRIRLVAVLACIILETCSLRN